MASFGIVTVESRYSVKSTMDRLAAEVTAKGVTVFARIDHAAGAAAAGMTLRPTELLIFGNPKAGTPLMQAAQITAIDLPLKALSWQDENGKVWLSYNDPHWIMRRHGLPEATPAVDAFANFVGALVRAAAA